VVEQLTFNQ